MSPTAARRHEDITGRILEEIGNGTPFTQRELSRKLGIALGLTNLLVRRIVQRGWVKVTHLKANRAAYLLTPTGVAEKARLTQAYVENTMRLYTETRGRIVRRFELLSTAWPADDLFAGCEKRIVFFGAGEVSEIGYISLQQTDLRLVGVIDDFREGRFFGVPICRPEALGPTSINGESFGRVIVMSFRRARQLRDRLGRLGFPMSRVAWLDDALDIDAAAGGPNRGNAVLEVAADGAL